MPRPYRTPPHPHRLSTERVNDRTSEPYDRPFNSNLCRDKAEASLQSRCLEQDGRRHPGAEARMLEMEMQSEEVVVDPARAPRSEGVVRRGLVLEESAYVINQIKLVQSHRRSSFQYPELGVPGMWRENGRSRQRVQMPGQVSDGLASNMARTRKLRLLPALTAVYARVAISSAERGLTALLSTGRCDVSSHQSARPASPYSCSRRID
jgi:hypothetical protein